nr:DapH/DapD/GlmU-related protein [Aminipila sp.]
MAYSIAKNVIIGENVKIGENVTIKAGCILEDNIVLGDNVYVDFGTIIHSNVTIDENSTIGARCILGEYIVDFYEDRVNKVHPLHIGKESLIRSENIIYGDNIFGDYLQTGHRVTIREKTKIGSHVRIGTLSDIQGHCEIQDYVNMHSNVHIGMHSVVKKYAWIFPYVVLTNDPNPPSNSLMGVTVEEFAIIATGSVVLPGKVIGNGALVGAGSVVTKDITEDAIAVGNPAKEHGKTEKLRDATTGEQVYPWRYTFDRGMPWEGIGYDKWNKENK